MSDAESYYGLTTDTEDEGHTSEDEYSEEFAPSRETVIIFIDVDSFEVQVRGMDEGYTSEELKNDPVIVVNEFGVITAVNYPAKGHGIKRSKECNEDVARRMCKNLKVLRIPDHYKKPDALQPKKASDKIYSSIESSLKKHCREWTKPVLEKASKDEFYIDITDEVFHRMNEANPNSVVPPSHVIGEMKLRKCYVETPSRQVSGDTFSYRTLQVLTNKNIIQTRHETEALLVHGAAIAHFILKDIVRETKFVCSAGVSTNKLLAKIGCGLHKPDAITVFPQSSLPRVSKKVSIEDIPGLGGKLGQQIKHSLRIQTMCQLGYVDRKRLQKFTRGEHGLKLHQLAIGHDTTKVVELKFSKTLTCGITFQHKGRTMYQDPLSLFRLHLRNRFLELREHLVYESRKHGRDRIPKSLRLEIRTRKKNLQLAFGDTVEFPRTLEVEVLSSAQISYPNNTSFYECSTMPPCWEALHKEFNLKIKNNCKIDVFSTDNGKAATAIRKISAIKLTANF